MINMKLNKDVKSTQLSELNPGDVFAFDPEDAEDGDVYVILDQSDVGEYVDFEKSNIPRNSIFVVSLHDGSFEYFDENLSAIELNSVQLSYRI